MAEVTTSPNGRAFLKREEGEVLRAYRDVVGVWTIGCGLTAKSGVVTPKHGMVITAEEADRLLTLALERNYEPAVRNAMTGAVQREFDGAVSFHFNTGGITRASWVEAWKRRDWKGVLAGLMRWVKGGDKVLPGLKARREREFRMMREGIYFAPAAEPVKRSGFARITLPMSPEELVQVRSGFGVLGYDPGKDYRGIDVAAVLYFQRDHDLTPDGVIGRATLSTLQRRLDARRKTNTTLAGGGLAGGATAAPPAGVDLPDYALWIVAGLTLLVLVRLGWSYRDVIAAKVARRAPALAAYLRHL